MGNNTISAKNTKGRSNKCHMKYKKHDKSDKIKYKTDNFRPAIFKLFV